MDSVERDLRKKLRGLRASHSKNMLALDTARGGRARKYKAKMAEAKRAAKDVEMQIERHLKNKTNPARTVTVRQPSEGRTVAVVGDVYRFLATGEDTNGKYALWEAIVPPGGGPPPHVHSREEEGFYILEGEITFTLGDKRLVATAGTFANMPVGTPHSFKNESNRLARMLISVAPAGLEKMFFEVGIPLPEGATTALPPTKDEIERLLSVAPRYGIEIRLPKH
jgi:quercetin dioxygenase-like cupin family protein